MELPVLIEPIAENGFRAKLGEPFNLVGEGATRQQAMLRLHELLDQRLTSGLEITSISVGNGKPAVAIHGGIWNENDPDVQEWLRTIEENRRLDDIREGIER